MKRYFAILDGRSQGPFATQELLEKGATRSTRVWCEGMSGWAAIEEVPEIGRELGELPPGIPDLNDARARQASSLFPVDQLVSTGSGRVGLMGEMRPSPYSPEQFQGPGIGWLFAVMLGVAAISIAILSFSSHSMSEKEAIGILVMGSLVTLTLFITAMVRFFKLLYRAWALIQDGAPFTTPGKAIGYCFIPGFNLYWIFIAISTLASDMNRYLVARSIEARPVSQVLSILSPVLRLTAIIPPVALFSCIPLMIVESMLFRSIQSAARAIALEKQNKFGRVEPPLGTSEPMH